MHHPENLSIKYNEQDFTLNLPYQGSIKQDYISDYILLYKCNKFQFLGTLIKISILILVRSKTLTSVKFLLIFFANKLSYENKSKGSTEYLVRFKEITAYTKGVCKSAEGCPIWIGLSELDNSYARWCCESSFFCIYRSSEWYQKHRVFD